MMEMDKVAQIWWFKLFKLCIYVFVKITYIELNIEIILQLPYLEIATNLSERQLSFKERLEGWNIERRQRETGRCDVVIYSLILFNS